VRRLSFELFGREIWAVAFGRPEASTGPHDPGTTASQIELAEPVRLGFHVPAIPSVIEVEQDID
jgi:hypothetical protein